MVSTACVLVMQWSCKSHSSRDYNYVTGINYITNIVTSHQHTPATIYPLTQTPNTQEKVWLTGNSCHYFSLSQCHSFLPSSQLRMMLDTLLQSFAAPFLMFCCCWWWGPFLNISGQSTGDNVNMDIEPLRYWVIKYSNIKCVHTFIHFVYDPFIFTIFLQSRLSLSQEMKCYIYYST